MVAPIHPLLPPQHHHHHRPPMFHHPFHPPPQQPITFPPPYYAYPLHYQDPTLYSPVHNAYIQIRRVEWLNFNQKMANIGYFINSTPSKVISMDTEYPGVIYSSSDINYRHPAGQYSLMKANVDSLELIQVGLTLSDLQGNLATLGPHFPVIVVWEFAISDFNLRVHRHNPDSIAMLAARHLDFAFHTTQGIPSHYFAQAMLGINLVNNDSLNNLHNYNLHWVTFHGAYDFGFLIKALTKAKLPNTLPEFLTLVERYFGKRVYDVRHMMRYDVRLFGGLENLAARIGVSRVLGLRHQAGSDSLLTQMVFQKIKDEYLVDQELFEEKIPGRIYPLII